MVGGLTHDTLYSASSNSYDESANHYSLPEVAFYCYCAETTNDDLAKLLVYRRHNDVEHNLMKLAVSNYMHKVMDTGVRVNTSLARGMGIAYAPIANDETSTRNSLLTPANTAIDVKSRSPLSVSERLRDKLYLVGVEWQ